jgi:hypothetical protein
LRGTLVAHLPADSHPRKIVFESKLEQRVLHLLLARRDVHDIWDQPPAVTYPAADGRQKRHVCDFLFTRADGRRIAIAVKPTERAIMRKFRDELQRIRAGTDLVFAQDVVLITDRSFTPPAARNAARLHEFRRTPDLEADEIVTSIIGRLTETTTIAEVVADSGLFGRAFRAAFRAIYGGAARVLDAGDITPASRIAKEVSQ